ncbi:MAG: serine/threonine protein kinase [Deltaproteobacteria bacterium]|nr:serine/threonine protein kinase [Deltaproteobacteria bacterium]
MTRVCPECGRRFDADVLECPDDGAPTFMVDKEADLIGRDLDGRFDVLELLGVGGMGAVYRARQRSTDRDVALKLLRPDMAGDETAIKRFFREARAASRLTNPHTITIFDFGQTRDGILFIAMELLKGRSLAGLLRETAGPLSPDGAVDIIDQVLQSLDEAHAEGILHRDLKPDNIQLVQTRDGDAFVKVLDFGIAKQLDSKSTALTATGAVFGTPTYMSPEQAQALDLDARSDLYSVGVILFEMLAGKPPFTADTPLAIAMKKAREDAPAIYRVNPDVRVPKGLERLVSTLLAKDPEDRPRDASAVRSMLRAATGSGDDRTVRMPDVMIEDRTTKIITSSRPTGDFSVDPGPAASGIETVPPDPRRWTWMNRIWPVRFWPALAVATGIGLAAALAVRQMKEDRSGVSEVSTLSSTVPISGPVGHDIFNGEGVSDARVESDVQDIDQDIVQDAVQDSVQDALPVETRVSVQSRQRSGRARRKLPRRPDEEIVNILKKGGKGAQPDKIRLKVKDDAK